MASLVVKSAVGEFIKKKKMRFSGASYDAISKKVEEILKDGVIRAKANKRMTVMPCDL